MKPLHAVVLDHWNTATYRVHNLDEAAPVNVIGRDLMENGLTIRLPDRPAAAIITYEVAGNFR